jgi:hypothetical protein
MRRTKARAHYSCVMVAEVLKPVPCAGHSGLTQAQDLEIKRRTGSTRGVIKASLKLCSSVVRLTYPACDSSAKAPTRNDLEEP